MPRRAGTKNKDLFKYISYLKQGDQYFIKGFYYRKKGRWIEAINEFKRSLEYHPNHKRAQSELVGALNRIGEYEEAFELAYSCYTDDPNNIYFAQEYFKCLKHKYTIKNDSLEKEAMLRNILEKLKNKGKKVLFIIDEIINNSYVKIFASNFQIYITQNYPVYLVMAGLFDNISNLQNEKSLTFLYRAPKIFLEPLSIPAITTSYRSVFDISPSEAVEMAKLTKGYPFAFQILGYLKWETNDDLEKLLPKFDEELIIYAYEKIWSELSELDRKIVYVISTGVYKTGEIREKLSISPQLLNTYRKRLMERGVVNGSVRGELTLALPRFEEYIEMYCEVEI